MSETLSHRNNEIDCIQMVMKHIRFRNQWGPPLLTCYEASLSNFLKLSLNIEATFSKLSSYSAWLLQLSRGLRIFESTPGRDEGYWRLKMGRVLY